MENKKLTIKDLVGKWVSYYSKIDGKIYSAGVPQYRTVLKIQDNTIWGGWRTLYETGATNYDNFRLADEVKNLLSRLGQLQRRPNRYGCYDIEGSMCITSSLLKQYLE